jgi:hypothetical protein
MIVQKFFVRSATKSIRSVCSIGQISMLNRLDQYAQLVNLVFFQDCALTRITLR